MTDKTENERGELVRKLQELAIWMAGCGYDFTQHEHYMRNRHLMTDDIAALSAQQAGEPVAKYCGRRHPPEGAPLYTAPPSGVREGMLRAAEICKQPKPECCGRFESDDHSMNPICCGKLEPGEFMDGLECAEAITRAAEQINAEGRETPHVSGGLEADKLPVPSAPPQNFLNRLESLMEKATKGPWSLFDVRKTLEINEAANPGRRPCVVGWAGFDSTDKPHRENQANARMIVLLANHAPAIAEVVRAVQPVVKGFTLQICDAVDDDELRGVRKQSIVLSLNEIRAILRALAALNAGKMEGE